jgi:hypothetical protein
MIKHTDEHNLHSTKIKVKDYVAVDYEWMEVIPPSNTVLR